MYLEQCSNTEQCTYRGQCSNTEQGTLNSVPWTVLELWTGNTEQCTVDMLELWTGNTEQCTVDNAQTLNREHWTVYRGQCSNSEQGTLNSVPLDNARILNREHWTVYRGQWSNTGQFTLELGLGNETYYWREYKELTSSVIFHKVKLTTHISSEPCILIFWDKIQQKIVISLINFSGTAVWRDISKHNLKMFAVIIKSIK